MLALCGRWLYASLLLGVLLALMWALSGCGGGRRSPSAEFVRMVNAGVELDDALAELDALPTPSGVDEGLFTRLKSALADALRGQGTPRLVSTPPIGPSNAVDDLSLGEGVGNWILTWSYRNTGDYNQDGTVNISDITPLAVHFNEASDETNEWIDGNGDSAINISDITPLAANFFHDCAGYSVQSSDSPVHGFTEFDRVELSDASGEGRLHFQLLLPLVMNNPYVQVVSFDSGGAAGAGSNVRGVPGMALSVISLSPRGGLAGTELQLSAEVDGLEPIAYLWDFGGGAEPDTSSEQSPTVTLGAEGTYDASLALTNDYCTCIYAFTLTAGTAANAPQINSVSPPGGIAGESVRFSVDVSGSFPFDYSWDFDGAGEPQTATVASPLLALREPGSYECSVTVSNDFGVDSLGFTVEVGVIGSAPRITSVSPLKAAAGHDEHFTVSVTGSSPFWYLWDFGEAADPSTYTDESPVVHIVSEGEHECNVTVSNVYGEDTGEFTLDVGLAATIESVNHGALVANQETTFSVTLSGGEGPFGYSWNFGGGASPNTSSKASPTVTMGDPGNYEGTVTVANYYGQESQPFAYEVLGVEPTINSVVPTYGGSGQNVMFVPDYTGTAPISFDWDFGGGADPNTPTEETPAVTLGDAGIYSASLTATNPWGSDTLNFDLRVGVRAIVDSGGKGSGGASLAIVNGRPAVAYYDLSQGDLLYCRANDQWGNTWGTPVSIDTAGDVGQFVSLAVVDGRPAVSYIASVLGTLNYARADDADGSTWGMPVSPDGSGVVGYTTLLVVDGRPAISYQGGDADLKYVRANDATGATWGSPQIVYATGTVGQYASMAIVNGAPAIAFYDGGNKDLLYVRSFDPAGSTWDTPVTLATTNDVGEWCSLAVIGGFAAVGYRNASQSGLAFVRAANGEGTLWNPPVAVLTGVAGGHTVLVEVSGVPALAFQHLTDGDLGYIRANDAQGTTWGDVALADTNGDTGTFNNGIIMSDDRPALVTVESIAGEVRYLLANDLRGDEWPMP